MTQQHENRRVRMTKRLLKDALLELMQKQDLIKISVTAICETADVHRSTFYNYYTDPNDLLREIEQDILDRIPIPPQTLEAQSQKALHDATIEFFDYIRDNKKTIQILFNESSGSNFSSLLVKHLCSGYIPVSEHTDALTARYIQLYIANGTVSIMREWVSEDFPVSNETLAELMYTLSRRLSQY